MTGIGVAIQDFHMRRCLGLAELILTEEFRVKQRALWLNAQVIRDILIRDRNLFCRKSCALGRQHIT